MRVDGVPSVEVADALVAIVIWSCAGAREVRVTCTNTEAQSAIATTKNPVRNETRPVAGMGIQATLVAHCCSGDHDLRSERHSPSLSSSHAMRTRTTSKVRVAISRK